MKTLSCIILISTINFNCFAQKADTIKISSGKPYVFLIDNAKYPVRTVDDNLES